MRISFFKETFRLRWPTLFRAGRFLKHFPARMRRMLTPYRLRRYEKNAGFHGDRIWQEYVHLLLSIFPVTSCVETGTYRGDTAEFLAKTSPCPVYTIELTREYYRESSRRLRDVSNVKVLRGSSPDVLRRLIDEKVIGDLPFFFLDAHWYDYWPILDELNLIARLPKAIIIIDDFQVPDVTWFHYDRYVEGTHAVENSIEYIRPYLEKTKSRVFFPHYRPTEAGFPEIAELRGYAIIFQNFDDKEWKNITKMKISNFYREFEPEGKRYH